MKKKSILIVDDQDECLHLFEQILSDQYSPLFYAKNGLEAFEILKSEQIELIITDYEMPHADGKWLLERTQDIPTIVLSASLRIQETEILKLGAKAFVSKPFSVKALLQLIDDVLKDDIRLRVP